MEGVKIGGKKFPILIKKTEEKFAMKGVEICKQKKRGFSK
jgi:hypothetical protein